MTIKCLVIDDHHESIAMIEQVIKRINPLEIIVCRTKEQAIEILNNNIIEIVFIDPDMPGIDGDMSFIQSLIEPVKYIVVISARRGRAKEAFDIGARDFLLKPFSAGRLVRTVGRIAKTTINNIPGPPEQRQDYFFIKHNSVMERVLKQDIYIVEALADYVNIYAGNKRYTIHNTMKNMEMMLGNGQFIRVHKSYIVRIDGIMKISENMVTVRDHSVPMSRNYRKQLLDKVKTL